MVELNTCIKNENDAEATNILTNPTIYDRLAGTNAYRDILFIIFVAYCNILLHLTNKQIRFLK